MKISTLRVNKALHSVIPHNCAFNVAKLNANHYFFLMQFFQFRKTILSISHGFTDNICRYVLTKHAKVRLCNSSLKCVRLLIFLDDENNSNIMNGNAVDKDGNLFFVVNRNISVSNHCVVTLKFNYSQYKVLIASNYEQNVDITN